MKVLFKCQACGRTFSSGSCGGEKVITDLLLYPGSEINAKYFGVGKEISNTIHKCKDNQIGLAIPVGGRE